MLKKKLALIGVIAIMLASLSVINADEWNKKTILTFDQPVAIPGAVLTPGTYVFKLANTLASRYVVQVFNRNQTELITTIMAIPDWRLEPRDNTILEFWETPQGKPVALRSWFYPGDNRGFEFRYPKDQANYIAERVHRSVPALERAEVDLKHNR